jgi:23S rRNA pseudouridine1911/1915/1917 synthase
MPIHEHSAIIGEAEAGSRIDRALATLLPDLSRTRLKALMDQGHVLANGVPCCAPSRKVAAGEVFTILVPEPESAIPQGENLPLTILFEDEHMLVIDKAAGMTVHPAPGNYQHTLVNALIAHCGASLSGIGGVRRPGIVHRLDKDTSGLMVAAKTDRAHARLSAQLADRTLSRRYLAIAWGRTQNAGHIDAPLGRSPADRKKMAVVAGGRQAITDYAFLQPVGAYASLIRCTLHTGRTHQIRVHMAHIGHPLVGDPLYGGRSSRGAKRSDPILAAFPRQALHAVQIGFIHPATGARMEFTSELPTDLAALIARASEQNRA